jgi:hypothetical protein
MRAADAPAAAALRFIADFQITERNEMLKILFVL